MIDTPRRKSSERTHGLPTLVWSSTVGAVLTSLLVSPLDVIKVRQQAFRNSSSSAVVIHNGLQTCLIPQPAALGGKGMFESARTILNMEGVAGLYRGLTPTLIM